LQLHSRGLPEAQEGKLRHLKTYAFQLPQHSPEIYGDHSGAIPPGRPNQI